jgi:hypothetical protein
VRNEYDEDIVEKIKDFFTPSGAPPKNLIDTEERVKGFVDTFSRITGDKVKDIYATCGRENGENCIALKDLWVFSERYIMLVEAFDKVESFRLFSARKKVSSLRITTEDYDFNGNHESFSESSRLTLEFTTSDRMLVEREARGAYCPHLARLIRLWVLPNLE